SRLSPPEQWSPVPKRGQPLFAHCLPRSPDPHREIAANRNNLPRQRPGAEKSNALSASCSCRPAGSKIKSSGSSKGFKGIPDIICVLLMCKIPIAQELQTIRNLGGLGNHVSRPQKTANYAACRKFALFAQLYRSPRQRPWDDARAVDCAVPVARAGGVVPSGFGRRARAATDLAGASA